MDMEASNSPVVLSAAAPMPATAADTGSIFFPTPAMALPADSNFLPASPTLASTLLVFAASFWRFLSSSSVSMISRWRASYWSGEMGFPNSSSQALDASWRVLSLSSVSWISFWSASYFSCEIFPSASCWSASFAFSFSSFRWAEVSSISFWMASCFAFHAS